MCTYGQKCVPGHLCPGLNAGIVIVINIWLRYRPFSFYFIFKRLVCVLLNVYQRKYFVMPIVNSAHLINVQSWT